VELTTGPRTRNVLLDELLNSMSIVFSTGGERVCVLAREGPRRKGYFFQVIVEVLRICGSRAIRSRRITVDDERTLYSLRRGGYPKALIGTVFFLPISQARKGPRIRATHTLTAV